MNRKKVGVAVVILLLVVGLGAGLFWYYTQRTSLEPATTTKTQTTEQVKVMSVCSDEQIHTASSAIEPYNADSLRDIATAIGATANHENDPNCMYILARYYMVTGQVDTAVTAVNRIQSLQTAGGKYSLMFNPPAVNVSDLRASIELMRSTQSSDQPTGEELNEIDRTRP